MATVKQEIMKRSLIINVANGVDDNGKTKIKAFTFGNLKAEAKVEDVFKLLMRLAVCMLRKSKASS